MKRIEKKLLPEYFTAVGRRLKTFELREDDSDYQIGDILTLREWDGEKYTGRKLTREITYILRDVPMYGLSEGYCILSIQPIGWNNPTYSPSEGETEARTETGSRKEALISLLRAYRGELAQAEYTAEVKDPLRMDIMDSLWKAENLLTGEEALRKHKAEE